MLSFHVVFKVQVIRSILSTDATDAIIMARAEMIFSHSDTKSQVKKVPTFVCCSSSSASEPNSFIQPLHCCIDLGYSFLMCQTNKCTLVLQFFRITQSFKFGHYVVFLCVFLVDTVHNVVCVDEVLVIVLNVHEVTGLALDHSVGFDIIIVFLI